MPTVCRSLREARYCIPRRAIFFAWTSSDRTMEGEAQRHGKPKADWQAALSAIAESHCGSDLGGSDAHRSPSMACWRAENAAMCNTISDRQSAASMMQPDNSTTMNGIPIPAGGLSSPAVAAAAFFTVTDFTARSRYRRDRCHSTGADDPPSTASLRNAEIGDIGAVRRRVILRQVTRRGLSCRVKIGTCRQCFARPCQPISISRWPSRRRLRR